MAEMNLEQRQYLTARFEEFVAVVHPSGDDQPVRKPYQWQIRLMLYVAGHGHWPQGIGAPTASGKTCVIDIHVFLNAMAGLVSAEGSAESQKLAGVPLQRIPRRLALTVNRRSLVDDQFDEASALQKRIQAENNESDKLDIYRKGLDLRSPINDALTPESPSPRMIAVELRGGVSPDREWRYYPQTCAVICATPDMFGSRLLFRGYGTSRTMRSMEAGLLAYDTVLIVDEAHLSRQLLKTARQVARIENMAKKPLVRQIAPLQVVETTATPASDDTHDAVSVEEADFDIDSALKKRLCTPKFVFASLDFKKPKDEIDAIVSKCVELIHDNEEADRLNDSDPHVLGCVLNTLDKGKAVAKALAKQCKKEGIHRPIDVYVGPMRAYDKHKVVEKLRNLSSMDPQDAPCCIIGTQTLEVGIDVDFANMVTEIAPSSALVQRAGRVNRRGMRPEGSLHVFGLDLQQFNEKKQAQQVSPYMPEDIYAAQDWLNSLNMGKTAAPNISAWSLAMSKSPIPGEKPGRLLFQRLEPWDVENLSVTDEDLCADISMADLQQGHSDLNIWLRDDLGSEDREISVAVRHLPWDDALAIKLLEVTQPENDELFPIRKWYGLTKFFEELTNKNAKAEVVFEEETDSDKKIAHTVKVDHRVFRYRASDPEGHRVVCMHNAKQGTVQSGDVLIFDDYEKVFSTFSEGVAIFDPEGSETAADIFNQCGSSLLVTSSDTLNDPTLIKVLQQIQEIEEELTKSNRAEFFGFAEESSANKDDNDRKDKGKISDSTENKTHKDDENSSDSAEKVMKKLLCPLRTATVDISDLPQQEGDEECSLIWKGRETPEDCYFDIENNPIRRDVQWVVSSASENVPDSESEQEILMPGKETKTLLLGGAFNDSDGSSRGEGHQDHVACRAQALGTLVGLDSTMVEDLRIAGEYHDEGKKDERFQKLLRNDRKTEDERPRAKSRFFLSCSRERELRNMYELHGWRHEQRSVAEFQRACENHERLKTISEADKQLIERLIGTSHGHGRATFRHETAYLLPQEKFDLLNVSPELNDISKRLFDLGEWETVIDHTNQRYGFWGISYLEALLRAADITCSKEGL